MGGRDVNNVEFTNPFEYDPVANTWAARSPIPTPVQDMSAIYAPTTNKIYVFGGLNSVTNVVYNTTQIYDVAAGTWSQGTVMPGVRFGTYAGYYIPLFFTLLALRLWDWIEYFLGIGNEFEVRQEME